MKLRYTRQKGSIAIKVADGNVVRWDELDQVHEIPDEVLSRLQVYIDRGWLVEEGKGTITPDPEDNLEKMIEGIEVEGKAFDFDEWIKTWDGESLPDELNSESELMDLKKEKLQDMTKAMELRIKDDKRKEYNKSVLTRNILEQFEEDP